MPLNLITLKLIRGSQLIRDTDSAAKADDNEAAIVARLAKRVDSFDCLPVVLGQRQSSGRADRTWSSYLTIH